MFNNIKDKWGEKLKPLKLPTVQQIAQAITPSSSNSSLSADGNVLQQQLSNSYPANLSNVSSDFFSIGDDESDLTQRQMHNIDLTANSPSNMTQGRSRRSSLSSVTSEASSMCPIFESSTNHMLQSDLESELEDSIASQLDRVSKEKLYQSYMQAIYRYNKYKGRYVDMSKQYRELHHDNAKMKTVLQESQDKALRRIGELREQCQLEQKAKAHLEESLRNDVEERDHIITTLKTKISLLKTEDGVDCNDNSETTDLVDLSAPVETPVSPEVTELRLQNEHLRKQIENLEKMKDTACHLIHRCDTTIEEVTEHTSSENIKEKFTDLKSEINKMKLENASLSQLLSKDILTEEERTPISTEPNSADNEKDKKIDKLNNLLLKCHERINNLSADLKKKRAEVEDSSRKLKQQEEQLVENGRSLQDLKEEVDNLKRKEEEYALTIAENKRDIHKELEAKELQIKMLKKELDQAKQREQSTNKEYEEKMEETEKMLITLRADNEMTSKQLMSELTELKRQVDSVPQQSVKDLHLNLTNTITNFDNMAQRTTDKTTIAVEKMNEKLENVEMAMKQSLERAQLKVNTLSKRVQEKEVEVTRLEAELASALMVSDQEAMEGSNLKVENNKLVDQNQLLTEELRALEAKFEQQILILETKRVEEVRDNSKEMSDQLRTLDEQYTATKEEFNQTLQDLNNAKEKIINLESEVEKQLTEKTELLNNSESANKSKVALEKQVTNMQKELTECRSSFEQERKELNAKVERAVNKVSEIKELLSISEQERIRLGSQVDGLSEELRQKTDYVTTLTQTEGQLKMDMEKISKEFEENMATVAELEETKDELNKTTQKLEDLKNTYEKKLEAMKINSEEEEEKRNVLQSLEVELKAELSECRNEIKVLRSDREQMKCLESNITELESRLSVSNQEYRALVEKNLEVENDRLKGEISKEIEKEQVVQKELVECRSELDRMTHDCGLVKDDLKRALSERDLALRELESNSVESKVGLKEKLELEYELRVKTELSNEQRGVIKALEDKLSALEQKMKEVTEQYAWKEQEVVTLRSNLAATVSELKEKIKELESERDTMLSENEGKLNVLKTEIKFLNEKYKDDIGDMDRNRMAECEEMAAKLKYSENMAAELLEKLERVTEQKDEISLQESEKTMKISELEACMAELKRELDEKFQAGESGDKLSEEVKQVVSKYEQELARKEDHAQSLETQLLEYSDLAETLKTCKQEIKLLRKELAAKDNLIEEKMEELIKTKQEYENRILNNKIDNAESSEREAIKIEEKMKQQKTDFDKVLRSQKSDYEKEIERIRSERDKSVEKVKEACEIKMKSLAEEYKKEKKNGSISSENLAVEANIPVEAELAVTSQAAVRAVESGSESMELLQKQLVQQTTDMKELKKQHKREVVELKKLLGIKAKRSRRSSESPEWGSPDTEHEYLRNILYEYMMGKEQLVLAKVLSAIVKFDHQQTVNVLEKEQHRQTLLGQLGIR